MDDRPCRIRKRPEKQPNIRAIALFFARIQDVFWKNDQS